MSNLARPPLFVSRCDRCGGVLARCEEETICPDCVSYTLAAEDVPPRGHVFKAATADGTYVHEGPDLDALAEWCRGVMDPGGGDVVVADEAGRVVAVLTDDGRLVRVR
jgi:hypothetical protein